MQLSQLLKKHLPVTCDREIPRLILDSRQIQPGDLFLAKNSTQTGAQTYIFDAIQKGSSLKPSSPLIIDALVIQTAKHSAVDAGKAARASIHFFPPITVKYDQFDPKKFMDDHWWEVVLRNGDPETNVRRTYFKTVDKMFEGMGKNIRWVVNSELALEN